MNFEQYNINKNAQKQDRLPELLRVGVFNKSGNTIPAMLPFSFSNGFLFKVNQSNSKQANRQLEYIVLELLNRVNIDLINFHIIDIGIKSNFEHLSKIKISNISIIEDPSKVTEKLEKIYSIARNISTNFLTGNIKSLIEFNETDEIKEPFNFVVIPNFPNNFSQDDLFLLNSIITDASNCGIYTFVSYNEEFLPEKTRFNEKQFEIINDILNKVVTIDCSENQSVLKNLNIPVLTRLINESYDFDNHNSNFIENLISNIKVNSSSKYEIGENFISIPIAKYGRNNLNFELGLKADAYHCMIAGQNGTGKSTFLNSIITQIAQLYSPDQIRLHLLDYKEGVEFKIYRNHPNVQTLLLDNSNIEFAINIFEKLEKEFLIRKLLFENLGSTISNIDKYNKISSNKIPYHLVIIDEAQELFTRGYEFNKKINKILTRIAKQGRAFGIHLILCTQTFSDCKIDDAVIKQTRLRISFRLSDGSDCRAILGRENDAPLYLKRFQIVYNSENGLNDKNLIANTNNFNENLIEEILNTQKQKYRDNINFEINIVDSKIENRKTLDNKESNELIETKVVSKKRELKTPNNFNDL